MSIDTTDTVRCSDCRCVLAKDDACKDSSQKLTLWYCHDCYTARQADQWSEESERLLYGKNED